MLLKWILFNAFVVGMLVLDLGVFHRKQHVVKIKEALAWSGVWIALALVFNGVLYFWQGPQAALEFLAGYLIEKSLSVDNILVFVLIFSYFQVPEKYQHRVLFWGIFGALVLRGVFIVGGAALLAAFHWVIYVFGAFLVFTGIRMAVQKEHGVNPESNPVVRLFRRLYPVTAEYHGKSFFVKQDGRRFATPLFIVLLVVDVTDLIFAVDSIPAIFAVTENPFIVYTSNVFAILGLRALYFALAGVVERLRFLKLGLAVVLVYVGIKMLLSETAYAVPTGISLGIIAFILAVTAVASVIWPKQKLQG